MLKTTLAGIAAATALLSSAPAAQAQTITPGQRDDLQCLLIYMELAGNEAYANNPEAQSGFGVGVGYYLGRLEGSAANRDWLAYIENNLDQSTALMSDAAGYERCGQGMINLGNSMIAFSERMLALGG